MKIWNPIDEALKVSLGLLETSTNLVVDDLTVVLNNSNVVPDSKKEQPKIKATIKGDRSKFHRWTLEEKQEYVQYYTKYGKAKTNAKYKTGNNTKQYYQRFLKTLARGN